MKLKEIFREAAIGQDIGVCFGRWNPPHKGHKVVWETAAQFDTFYIGTNQNTQGPDDPLPYDVKLQCMSAVWPGIDGHVIPEKNLFTLVARIYEKYGEHVHLKVCTDEAWLTDALVKYNGKESANGYYKFASIQHVPTPRLSSATALRSAVRRGDKEDFSAAAGVSWQLPIAGSTFFDIVSHYLSQFPEKVKRAKKEKATAEDAAGVGIITKQNSTVDVNSSTPKKNLKAFNLVKEANARIREMRAKEFLKEGDLPADLKRMENPSVTAAIKGGLSIPGISINKSNGSPYQGYRFGLAMASADGKGNNPTPAVGAMAGDPLLSVFTQEEYDIVKQAAKDTLAGPIKKLSSMTSEEVSDVNKTSPVAKPKRNKYGV
jgi:hypothetical protein